MHTPRLIILGGFAGAGKTTIATRLSSTYNYPVLSSDVINDALRPALQIDFHEASPISYEILWHLVRQQLKNNLTVILDANMCSERVWQNVEKLRQDMPHVTILPLILQCSLETHRARIDERGRTNKEHLNLGGDILEDVLFKYEFIENLQRSDLIRIDANGEREEVYATVEHLIHSEEPARK